MQEITLQPGESVTIRAAAATQPPTTEPPGGGGNPPVEGQFIGELHFDGRPFLTQGLKGQPWSYCSFIIPQGYAGKVSQVTYAENATYGGMQISKTVAFTQVAGDFSVPRCIGASGNVMVAFEHDRANAVKVMPGEVWYMCFGNWNERGETASAADNGNFMITPGAPTISS